MLLAKTFCVLFVAHYRDGEGLKGGLKVFFILVVTVLGVGSIQQCSYLDIFFCFSDSTSRSKMEIYRLCVFITPLHARRNVILHHEEY